MHSRRAGARAAKADVASGDIHVQRISRLSHLLSTMCAERLQRVAEKNRRVAEDIWKAFHLDALGVRLQIASGGQEGAPCIGKARSPSLSKRHRAAHQVDNKCTGKKRPRLATSIDRKLRRRTSEPPVLSRFAAEQQPIAVVKRISTHVRPLQSFPSSKRGNSTRVGHKEKFVFLTASSNRTLPRRGLGHSIPIAGTIG